MEGYLGLLERSSNCLSPRYHTGVTSATPNRRKTERRKPKFPAPQWYWATRGTGLVMVFYGMLVDHTPDRGTLIITGAGLIGVDKVLRSPGGDPPASG
jgi:hypothetical protein